MKATLRKHVKRTLADLSEHEILSQSHQACHRVADTSEFKLARVVMAYLAMPGELDPASLILSAWQEGKTVVVPKISWAERHMVAVELKSLEEGLETNSYGIEEPEGSWPHPVEEIDFVALPGLAFDRDGHRLGRGGGYYDKFLSHDAFGAVTCGLAFSQQVLDEVPV